jgi:hypothetical protein
MVSSRQEPPVKFYSIIKQFTLLYFNLYICMDMYIRSLIICGKRA